MQSIHQPCVHPFHPDPPSRARPSFSAPSNPHYTDRNIQITPNTARENGGDAKRKTLKVFQDYSTRPSNQGLCEENWARHPSEFTAMSQLHEVTDPDKVFLLRFSLGEDAREFYDSIQDGRPLSCIVIVDAFNHRYRSSAKQTEISARLHALTIDSSRDSGYDHPTALDKFVQRINKHCPLVFPRDIDDDAKNVFYSKRSSARIGVSIPTPVSRPAQPTRLPCPPYKLPCEISHSIAPPLPLPSRWYMCLTFDSPYGRCCGRPLQATPPPMHSIRTQPCTLKIPPTNGHWMNQ